MIAAAIQKFNERQLTLHASKFIHPGTEVMLSAYANAARVLIDVEDHCGGFAPGDAEQMFLPFKQRGEDKSGMGLGLAVSRRSVEANDGFLTVRDVAGRGCVFTIDLPTPRTMNSDAGNRRQSGKTPTRVFAPSGIYGSRAGRLRRGVATRQSRRAGGNATGQIPRRGRAAPVAVA